MATEADIPESKSIPKIECEDEDQKSRQLDRTVDESFLEGFNKVDDGLEKLPGIVENSANADTTKETAVGTITVDTVFTGDVGTLQGESFLKSPSVAKVAYEETCSISEQDQTDKILKRAEKENSEDRNQLQKDQENETGSGENEGMEKTKEIAKNGNDSLNALGEISLQQTETEQPALQVGGQSSEEERNIDQHVQIVDSQQAFVEEKPESMTEAICSPEEDKSGETEPEKDTEPESTKQFSDIAEATLSQNKEDLYHTLDSAEDSLDKEVETVTEACDREVSINKNFSAKTPLIEEELEEKNLKAEEKELEKPYNTTGNEKGSEAVEASENEGEEKREADHISCDEFTDDSISILKQNPDIENDETKLEVGEGTKEDKSGETEPEKDAEPESTKQISDITEATLSQNKEALYHTLDSAEDSLDKEVETATEACDREVSINKNFSAKTPLIEEELEEKNLKAEEKEPEKPFNTMGNEKGSEAVGASENEGEEKREADHISCDAFTDDSISILKQNPAIENDETKLEIGEGTKEDKSGETEPEKDAEPESTKQFSDITEATLSQNKEALYHTLDPAEDSLDKEVETVTEACDREVSINKNFSAKTPLIEEELEEKNLKAEEKEPEKPFNTMGNEKGSEAVGASENEGEEKREAEDISCDEFRDDSISILKQNPDIENDETMLEIGEGAKDMVDGPSLTLVKDEHPIEDEIEDKNNLDIPFVRQTEERCCQKVENPVIFEGFSEIGSGDVKKSPPEEHQAEILEKYAQAAAYGNGKDDEVDEQKEVILSRIQVQAMIEASAGEKRIEENFTFQPEKNIRNTESAEDEEHLKEDKSKHEECPEQTFLQHNETSEIKETDASSESVGTITCVQDEISMKILEESFDKERKEDKPTDTVEISEHSVPKEKNFPLLDLNEVIERAEAEIPKEDEIDLHVTHSFLEDTDQMDGEMLDKQKFEETIIGSTEITTLEHTSTGGEQLQEAISITNSIEAGKLENKLDYDNKTEVEDVKEKIDEELQKNEETFDKETHEIATKCDDTEAGCIAEDAPVKVHSTVGEGEEPSDQISSELRSKDYSYRSEDDAKSNINKVEEAHDGPRIPAPQDVTEEQIIEGNIRYLSPESIEETAKNFHDDGDEEERSKEEDSKDHIIEEGNYIDQLPDLVAESQDFQDDEKEADQSKREIFEESETAQASKSLIHETNQDDESPKFFYHGALFTQQEERERGEIKEPSVMVAVPNLEENLEKEVKEAEKDMNDASETGIEKEEDIELLPEASEPRERTESKESTDLILNSKESETNVEKLKMGYKLEPEEESESKDSKEIIEKVLVNEDPVIASTDLDSEKHIIQEERTVVDISPKVIGEETSKSSTEDGKADEHNEEVCEIIQKAVESDEDTQRQIIEENSVTKDSSKVFQTTTAGEDTREQIREEIENFKYQSPKSIEEETLKENYKENEVCEEFMIPVSSTHKEKQNIDEHATPDLSSLPVGEKVVNESSKECETKGIELKEEVEDPNLEFKEQIEATDSTEELKLETLRDRAATFDAETLPKESNESFVEGFLLSNVSEWENNKDTLEKEEPTINDSETASAAVVTTVLECSKETEPEGDKQVEESDLTSKEKGLETTETKDAMPGSEYINVKPQETSNLEVISDTEILTVVNEAGEKVEYAMPEPESKDQMEVIEEHNLMINNVNPTPDEIQTQNKKTLFIVQTPEKLSFQTEDGPACLTDDSELDSLELGIKSENEEVAKQSNEELSVPPEISNVKYISGSEDVEFLKEEVASEIANQSDISKSEILKDNDSSNVVDQEAKSENEKPLNEASKCIEGLGTFTNSEKAMEQEDLAEKFEANLKDIEEEKRVVELEAEIRSQESGPSDTKETCTHKEENLESADPGKELECASESVPENTRNKTLTETSDTQINENNSIQYQNTESVEQQNTEPEVQECEKEMDEEVELKGDNEDNIKGPQSADETRSDVILTKEILTVSEQVDEKDNITEQIIQEERDTTEDHSASTGEEMVHEVENCDPASDSIVHMKTVNLENEKLREGDASSLTIASNEAAMERQGDENPEDVSIRVAEVSEENDKEGIIEQEDNCSDKLDIASVTVVKEEKSLGEPQPDDKLGEGFNNVAGDRSLQPIVKSETSPDGEGVDSLKFEETLDSISKVPTIHCEDVDKENVIVEKQVENEIEETKNASHAIFEIKDQSDNDIDKTGRSLDVEEPDAEEIENEKHEHVIMNIIEKGEEENINSEDTFGTKTVEETYLQNEEPRELDFSKPIEGIQKNNQNEPLKEEGHTSTEEKLKSQEDVSEMSNVDSPSNEENSELIRPTEYSSLGGSKEERILDLGGSNKNDDCSTTTRSLGEGILPEVGEECKETSYPQCHEALADSEETQIKEVHLEALVVELRSEENQFEGNDDINNEISNEEISKVAEKVDEKENIPEQIIHEERDKMEHNSVFSGDKAVEEVENCDPVSAKNLKSMDSVVHLETLNLAIEEQPTRVGDVSPITKGLNEAKVEIQDNEKVVGFSISTSEVSKENVEEGIIGQGTNCSDKLDLASVTVIAKEKSLGEPQLDTKLREGFNNVTEDISLQPIVITETTQEGEGSDSLKFEKTSHLISKFSTMECEDEDKENTAVEKQVTDDIEDTRNAFHAVAEVKSQSVKEIDETWKSLSVEEPDAGEFNEEIKHEHVTMNTIENREDGKINMGGFIGTKTTEETLPNEKPMELEVSEPIKGIQKDSQNEKLKEESDTSAEDLKVKSQEDVSEMSDVDYLSSEKNNEQTRPAEYSSQEAPKDKESLDLGGSNKNDDCSTTTRSLGEGILPEVGEECKETSYPQCHEAIADSEETQIKEAHLEELRSEENQFEGNNDINNEISNEEISKVSEKVDEKENIPEQNIHEERGKMEHNSVFSGDKAVEEVENCDPVSAKNLKSTDSVVHLETLNLEIEEHPTRVGDGDVSQEDVSEMSDVDYLSSEKNNEQTRPAEYSSQEAPKDKEILDLGGSNKSDDYSTTTRSLGEGILPEVGEECKETSYPQCHEAIADSEETQIKEAHLEAPVVELRSEENQFEGNDDIKNEISNEEITEIKEADKESHQVSVSEDTIKEIHQEDELMVEESPRERTKEAVTTAQNNTRDEEVSEEIQKASTSMNIITPHEDRAAKDHDLVFVEHDNESLPEETEGKNFKEATTKSDLENEFDSRNFKDWIEAINLREQETPDSELDLDTTGTNYTKESAITQKEEEPNTNLDVPLGTGPATEGSVHVNEDEKIEEASETHPRELVHEIEKDIVVQVVDNQENLMEYEKHTHTSLESASDGLEIEEDLKVNGQEAYPETGTSSVDGNRQEVYLETGTSSVDGNPKEEIPDDDRKIREDEKKHNLATDKHIAVEMNVAAEKAVINDEREHTEYKEPLDDSTRERAEIDNRICKNEDKEIQDQNEKPDKFINIHDLDIAMLQRGSTADLSGANETTQNIQKLEKTSDYTSEKLIPRERDPNESKEIMVASGDKDVQPVVEDPFAKNLQKTEVEDLKPKPTTTVESEQEVVKSDEDGKNFKDWIEAINLREQATPDSEFDLDTAGTNYNKESAITQMEEEPNTNLGVPQATGPATKVVVHVEDEKFEEASESHPRELVHETEKDIAVAVADNQESLVEHENHTHTSLESTSDGLEVKEDLKLNGQEVSPDTGTSSVDGNTQEEILEDDRKIRENEKQYNLATDKHVGVEMSIAAERTTINDEREHTEYKESLEDSTRGSDRKLDEAGIDSILCQNEDREPQDQTEKADNFINIHDLDIAMLRKGSNTDLSEANETIQNIQKLEKASDSTSEKQIPREIDPNEKKETMVASGDKDVEPVLEDSFAKTLQKPEVDDLKPETTPIVDPEHIGVVCDEGKRTDDAGEEKISSSHLLQKSTRETLPMAGHVSEEKEPTLAKEEMQAEKAEETLQEEEAKTDEEKYEEEEGDEHKKEDSGSDAPVMVEASRDMDIKVSPKKHHGILSGVGSKVKHSISKVKKAIIGKSSHSKPLSPK